MAKATVFDLLTGKAQHTIVTLSIPTLFCTSKISDMKLLFCLIFFTAFF